MAGHFQHRQQILSCKLLTSSARPSHFKMINPVKFLIPGLLAHWRFKISLCPSCWFCLLQTSPSTEECQHHPGPYPYRMSLSKACSRMQVWWMEVNTKADLSHPSQWIRKFDWLTVCWSAKRIRRVFPFHLQAPACLMFERALIRSVSFCFCQNIPSDLPWRPCIGFGATIWTCFLMKQHSHDIPDKSCAWNNYFTAWDLECLAHIHRYILSACPRLISQDSPWDRANKLPRLDFLAQCAEHLENPVAVAACYLPKKL